MFHTDAETLGSHVDQAGAEQAYRYFTLQSREKVQQRYSAQLHPPNGN